MNRPSAVLLATLVGTATSPCLAAPKPCTPHGGSVPAGANTTHPSAPFFIQTAGLDLRTKPPTRDPHNPAYPPATELPDGTLPSPDADGNFIIGPTHAAAPESVARDGIPHGTIRSFTMTAADSLIYRPGVVRDDPGGCPNEAINTAVTAPGDPSNLIVTASHAGNWTRQVDVYVPAELAPGSVAPFIVFGDGGPAGFFHEHVFFTILDNMIAAHRLPPMVAIGIGAGGQDAQGSERGREYDTVSGLYAEWVEHEVLPAVEQTAGVRLTTDPDARATMGFSSSGSAAFTMAWFHPELYHRVLAYSPTMVNQQWPHDPALPGGAWEFHDRLAWTSNAGACRQREIRDLVGLAHRLSADPEQPDQADPLSGSSAATVIFSITSPLWLTACTTGRWLTSAPPRCSPRRATITSSSSLAMPRTSTTRPRPRPYPKLWSGCGRVTPRRLQKAGSEGRSGIAGWPS